MPTDHTREGLPRNQASVLRCLQGQSGRALTAYDLLARLGPSGMRGPQTVYRALDSLVAAGLVHRVKSLNAFIACSHADEHHGHGHQHAQHRPAFAVCRNCGAVQELEDDALAAVLGVVAARTGYRISERVIELVGACPACLKQNPALTAASA